MKEQMTMHPYDEQPAGCECPGCDTHAGGSDDHCSAVASEAAGELSVCARCALFIRAQAAETEEGILPMEQPEPYDPCPVHPDCDRMHEGGGCEGQAHGPDCGGAAGCICPIENPEMRTGRAS